MVENSLEVINPDLCKEWNYKRNKNLHPKMFTANSGEKVWWICKNNHEWEAVIGSRNNGRKCPICTNRKLQIGFNDLKTLFPELACLRASLQPEAAIRWPMRSKVPAPLR